MNEAPHQFMVAFDYHDLDVLNISALAWAGHVETCMVFKEGELNARMNEYIQRINAKADGEYTDAYVKVMLPWQVRNNTGAGIGGFVWELYGFVITQAQWNTWYASMMTGGSTQ